MDKNVLTIRIPKELKKKIEKVAEKQGVSMNQFALYAFTKEIGELETDEFFKQYLKNKSKEEIYENFNEAMSKVKEREVPDWDETE